MMRLWQSGRRARCINSLVEGNELLTLDDLPALGDVKAIKAFARSFNGYDNYGSFHACASAASKKERLTIEQLRNELFFAYRAGNHHGNNDVSKIYEELYPVFTRLVQG
ncbi:MAG: hypothetical protein AAF337_12030 [Pseudomonadota bacterium]